MAFKDILHEVVAGIEGGRGAVMMGFDGITVDEYQARSSSLDLQVLSAEYAALLKEIQETVASLKEGALEEVTIASERSRVVMRKVDEEYFVALIMDKSGNLGKGRYLLQSAAFKLREELA